MNEDLDIAKIEDRFFVRGRMEIREILTDLVLRCEPVAVYFNGGAERLDTTLLDVHDKAAIFEAGSDQNARARLLQAKDWVFVALPDGIRVQFAAVGITEFPWDDSTAFCMPLPEKVARLQRQESFRLQIPAEHAITAILFADDGSVVGEWPMHDLSTTGIGLSVNAPTQHDLASKISRVRLSLPQYGEIDCMVLLRHTTSLVKDQAGLHCRVGMKFSNLPVEMRVIIQRYIIKTEHERRSMAGAQAADDTDLHNDTSD